MFFSVVFVVFVFVVVYVVMCVLELKMDEDEGEILLLRDFVVAYRESGVDDYVSS